LVAAHSPATDDRISHGCAHPAPRPLGLQALPEWVARPEGSGRTPPTIVIEGVDELVEALLVA
jgi:hypothetical protein